MAKGRYSQLLLQKYANQIRDTNRLTEWNPSSRRRTENISTAGYQDGQDRFFLILDNSSFFDRNLPKWHLKRFSVCGDGHCRLRSLVVRKESRQIKGCEIVHIYHQQIFPACTNGSRSTNRAERMFFKVDSEICAGGPSQPSRPVLGKRD